MSEVGARLARARRRRHLTQLQLAERLGRSESYISKLEQGQHALNDLRDARRIAEVLDIDVLWLLVLDGSRRGWRPSAREDQPKASMTLTSEELSQLLRRTMIKGGLGVVGAALGGGVGLLPSANGSVDTFTVADLEAISSAYRRAYRRVPAHCLLPATHDHMQLVLGLNPASQREPARSLLLTVAGEMAVLAGVVLMLDMGDFRGADPYLGMGLRLAVAAGSDEVHTVALGSRAFHAAYSGNPGLGLQYAVEACDIAARRASVTTRGWVAAIASEMHATLGHEHDAMAMLDSARTAISQPDVDIRWRGIGAFDLPKLTAYEGGDLVRLSRYREAMPILDDALEQLDQSMLRHRCTALVDRAAAKVGADQIDAACADIDAALEIIVETPHEQSLRRIDTIGRAALATGSAAARRTWGAFTMVRASTPTAGYVT